jgi:hypothetical protein
LSVVEGLHEALADGGIGREGLLLLDDLLVVDEELAFEDLESVEFIEQIGGGAEGDGKGILGGGSCQAVESLVGAGEIEIVKALHSQVDGGSLGRSEDRQAHEGREYAEW